MVSTAVGTAVALVGLFFVVRALINEWDEVSDALEEADWRLLIPATVLAVLAMVAIALPWGRALELLGAQISAGRRVALYFAGEIGKYVPGGVWPVIGRGELAVRSGVERGTAYSSVALSLGVLYLASLIVCLALLPLAEPGDRRILWVLVLLPLGLLALHHAVVARTVGLVERVARRSLGVEIPSWGAAVGLVLRYVPAWILVGTSTWVVSEALGGEATWGQVVFAAVLSWFVGFAAVPVPGGVGVREAVFVAAAPGLDAGLGAAVALVSRVLFMATDAGGAAIASAWLSGQRARGGQEVADGTD